MHLTSLNNYHPLFLAMKIESFYFLMKIWANLTECRLHAYKAMMSKFILSTIPYLEKLSAKYDDFISNSFEVTRFKVGRGYDTQTIRA